ncbi:MAG: hypothetical protein IJ744_02890 [Lachnospiraceae bacterium]|nr:hypothetical protein [Lachnospiraceae bacterium]
MNRKKKWLWILVFAILVMAGCGKNRELELPENPVKFVTYDFINPENAEDGYRVFDYEGRTYLPYGTLKTSLNDRDLSKCLGFVVQDEEELKDVLVYSLKADPEMNYLVMRDQGFMSQPTFLRAIDTLEKEIETPDYIQSLDYEYWE